jgi:peptidyl-prolyl cis-trans isomerase C
LAIALSALLAGPAMAQDDKVVAKVDGVAITEADLANAQSALGAEAAGMPAGIRRRQAIEFLITNQLLAEAGLKKNLQDDPAFEQRMKTYRRLALSELFFEKDIRGAVTEAEAKKVYDQRVAEFQPQLQVRARHILKRLGKGEDFAKLAKAHSKDAGAEAGGDLGYFGKGDMVKPFDEAVFALEVNKISEPVQTQFGWHVVEVLEKGNTKPNSFEDDKGRIMAELIQQKMGTVVGELRAKAKVEITDPELKKTMESPAPRGSFGQ